ncbi:hypothetical protein [Nocardioides bizhenqiangii]|uniref:Peptidase C39 domain-containing protein n=1 Tax=Nocardioides bizhenqiangii TaxID=3095076 RepID=A0ABZ0ZND0_9ACTN|nr:hypothetical protein [Nocardioides sp. HM61]WQQ25590.1 hypothetical protein SHK19_16685 [Nocardioides sp. HM61]
MDWPADLRPAALKQPDARSCGAASVVAARVLLTSWRPDDPGTAIRSEHRRLTSSHSHRERFQVPWPRRLGTPPWAVANALTALTGERIATVNARPRPGLGYDVLVEQVRTRPVGVYVGNRWLPRHVVLAIAAADDGAAVRVFDPARGDLVAVPRERWQTHRVGAGRWSHLWFVL